MTNTPYNTCITTAEYSVRYEYYSNRYSYSACTVRCGAWSVAMADDDVVGMGEGGGEVGVEEEAAAAPMDPEQGPGKVWKLLKSKPVKSRKRAMLLS